MGISVRTPTTNSAINGGNITLTLPSGMVRGDVVYVAYAMNAAGTGGTSSGGWTRIGSDLTNTTRIQIFRKVMGATPDANIVLTGTTAAADSSTAIAYALVGVDTTTPEDGVAMTTATGSSTNPNPPAITPATGGNPGAAVLVFAATSVVDTTGTAAPTNYVSFAQVSGSDTNSNTIYGAIRGALSGGASEDPGTFTGVSTAAWVAVSIAIRAADSFLQWDHAPSSERRPSAYNTRNLTAAILATTAVAWTPPAPPAAVSTDNYGFQNSVHRYSPAGRSQTLLGQVSTWPAQTPPAAPAYTDWFFERWPKPTLRPPRSMETFGDIAFASQVPNTEYQEGWRSRFTDPPIAKQLTTASRDTSWQPYMPPRVPEREFQEGWRSRFQEPAVFLRAKPRLEGAIEWTNREPETQFQEGWRHRWTDPPPPPRSLSTAARDTSWLPALPPRTPETEFQEGWRSAFSNPVRMSPLPRQEGSVEWAGYGYALTPAATPTEWWFERWQNPVLLSPRRAVNLLESWPWVGYGYFFQVQPGAPPTEWWFERWPAPPVGPARSVDLRGAIAWEPQDFRPSFGWFHRWSEPAKAPARSVQLLGQLVWPAQVPNVEFQEGWRSAYSQPSVLQRARRATKLLESWPWPGAGFSFLQVAATPTELWWPRWQDPPIAAARSVALRGSTVYLPRVPDREFQEGWRSLYSNPPVYGRPRSARDLLLGWRWPLRVPEVEYREGWRSAYSQPPTYSRPRPRFQGAISLVIVPPVVVLTPTQFGFYAHWQEPPAWLQRLRSIALRTGSWAQWPPQVIIQIVPTVPTCGTVTIHFRPRASTVKTFRPRASVKGQLRSHGSVRMKNFGCIPDEEET